jgi:hypothetical protein
MTQDTIPWNKILYFFPNIIFCGLRHAETELLRGEGGDDVRKFEPVNRFNIRNLDLTIRQLRKLYKENPAHFNIPDFAKKIY